MKNVIININGLGINQFYQACVYIYDKNKNLITSCNTYNSKVKVCLKINEVYTIKIISFKGTIISSFYVLNSVDNYYFSYCNTLSRRITFLLSDSFYNIPIERGEIFLWQKL